MLLLAIKHLIMHLICTAITMHILLCTCYYASLCVCSLAFWSFTYILIVHIVLPLPGQSLHECMSGIAMDGLSYDPNKLWDYF